MANSISDEFCIITMIKKIPFLTDVWLYHLQLFKMADGKTKAHIPVKAHIGSFIAA